MLSHLQRSVDWNEKRYQKARKYADVAIETLDEFRENGMVVRFVHPTIDAEVIKSYMNDEVMRQPMVTMSTINYEPTEGLL